jgi:predicted DNA-binding transcriptional regulator AlpA
MKLFSLAEAAQFLRMSRSNLYQRKDIPRYRRPGSRVLLFDQEELETWLKRGRICSRGEPNLEMLATQESHRDSEKEIDIVVDIPTQPVYHRSARYR